MVLSISSNTRWSISQCPVHSLVCAVSDNLTLTNHIPLDQHHGRRREGGPIYGREVHLPTSRWLGPRKYLLDMRGQIEFISDIRRDVARCDLRPGKPSEVCRANSKLELQWFVVPRSLRPKIALDSTTYLTTGTAIYVYGILAQATDKMTVSADISFFVDDQPAGSFQYLPSGPSSSEHGEYIYNTLLWHTDSLSHEQHIFSLQNGNFGGTASLILFDYMMYTR